MARDRVRLDHRGVGELLKSQLMARAVEAKTDEVADAVRGMNIQVGGFTGGGRIALPVESKVVTTDRAHGLVTLAHPAGEAVQAKRGALTKAAAQSGLEVKGGDK